MRTFGLVIAVALAASSTYARIGETETQIEKRYGKAFHTFSKPGELLVRGYVFRGVNISVTYLDGVSQSEIYLKPESNTFSDTELKTLMDANAGEGGEWVEEPEVTPSLRQWKLRNGERIASYATYQHVLIVQTEKCRAAEAEQKKAQDKAKLKDF